MIFLSLIFFNSIAFSCPSFEFNNLTCQEKYGSTESNDWKIKLATMGKNPDIGMFVMQIIDHEGYGQMEFPYSEVGDDGIEYSQYCEGEKVMFFEQLRFRAAKRELTINNDGFTIRGESLVQTEVCESLGACKDDARKQSFYINCVEI